jgi:hypothetical protein
VNAGDGSETTGTGGPLLRIVRGRPDVAEVAALAAVLLGAGARRAAPAAPATVALWVDRKRGLRRCPDPGPGAWRDSVRPR